MEEPRTRKEKKGNKAKKNKELGKYTTKHIRIVENKLEKAKEKNVK